MNLFSRFTKKREERMLIVDIGSATVTVSLAEQSESGIRILAAEKSDIPVESDLNFEKFQKEMLRALHASLARVTAQHLSMPEKMFVYLASPWYASQIRTAKLARPTSFVVTKEVLSDILKRELKAFEDEEIAAKHMTPDALTVIESKTLSVRLNGYPHDSPINASAHQLELSLFVSVAPEALLAGIRSVLDRSFPHAKATFSSFQSASYIVARDLFPHKKDYLLVDIGGEVTDVAVVKDDVLTQSVSFPLGRNFLLRRLSRELGRSISESITLCTLYMEGKVEEGIQTTCERVLMEARKEWLDAFQKNLFSISSELSVPDTILVTVDNDVAPWFIETIIREEFQQYALTQKEFEVIQLKAELFHESLTFATNVMRDPFTMLEVFAATKK